MLTVPDRDDERVAVSTSNSKKRLRTDHEGFEVPQTKSPSPRPSVTLIVPLAPLLSYGRVAKLRLSDEFAKRFGARYCTQSELVELMVSNKVCSPVSTFEVQVKMKGDPNEWMSITLDEEHASVAHLKRGVERLKGIMPTKQEIFRFNTTLQGTIGIDGSSEQSMAMDEANFLRTDHRFVGPCSVLMAVNDTTDVVLEGQQECEMMHGHMGVYERVKGEMVNGKGVWGKIKTEGLSEDKDHVLYYASKKNRWMVSTRNQMEMGKAKGAICSFSYAATPDQSIEAWQVIDIATREWVTAPRLRARLCSSFEKRNAVLRMQEEESGALAKARSLIAEALMGSVSTNNDCESPDLRTRRLHK
jgi:hypothetical protein